MSRRKETAAVLHADYIYEFYGAKCYRDEPHVNESAKHNVTLRDFYC